MALQHEAWVQSIEENLFQGAEFIDKSIDHSEFIDKKTVHIPQSGSNPAVTKNRSSYPATVAQRTDAEVTYNLNTYDTEPILVPDVDEAQTSYNKRQSLLSQHVATLTDEIALNTAYAWASNIAANQVRTTGSLVNTALAPSATGTRKELTKDDIRSVARIMDAQKLPRNGRFMLMDSEMYWQLFSDDTVVGRDFASNMAQEEGVVNELFGISIMKYNAPVIYDNAGTPLKKAVGAAGAITDNLACLAWSSSFVSKAMGDTKVFLSEDEPTFYGSVLSAMLFHAASPMRSNDVGLVSIVQEA